MERTTARDRDRSRAVGVSRLLSPPWAGGVLPSSAGAASSAGPASAQRVLTIIVCAIRSCRPRPSASQTTAGMTKNNSTVRMPIA